MKNRSLLVITLALMVAPLLRGQEYEWTKVEVDGTRTGVISPSGDNMDEALGKFERGKYIAPNGNGYKRCGMVGRTAKIVMDAQPKMARVKDVIGYSADAMVLEYPESALSNWFVDLIMAKTENLAGKKVDVGVANFGGIRIDMPQGDIILDDMLSMFPFKNQLVYVEHTGRNIRKLLEGMAAGKFQVLGGVRVVAEDGRLVSAEIAGEPIDDDRVYGMATISFLLEGGDGLFLGRDAVCVKTFYDVAIIDAVLEYVNAETAAGRSIRYRTDGRVLINDLKEEQ